MTDVTERPDQDQADQVRGVLKSALRLHFTDPDANLYYRVGRNEGFQVSDYLRPGEAILPPRVPVDSLDQAAAAAQQWLADLDGQTRRNLCRIRPSFQAAVVIEYDGFVAISGVFKGHPVVRILPQPDQA